MKRRQDAAAFQDEPAGQNLLDRFRIDPMLDLVDLFLQALHCIRRKHPHRLLNNDRTMVDFLIDKMDRDPGDADAVTEGVLDGMLAGKGRQESGMDIQDTVPVGPHEQRREDPHKTCQDDQIDFLRL